MELQGGNIFYKDEPELIEEMSGIGDIGVKPSAIEQKEGTLEYSASAWRTENPKTWKAEFMLKEGTKCSIELVNETRKLRCG